MKSPVTQNRPSRHQSSLTCCVPRVVFYGASGHSLACAMNVVLRPPSLPIFEVVAFIDDFRGDLGQTLNGVPIISFEHWRTTFLKYPCVSAVGDPRSKRSLVEKLISAGGHFQRTLRSAGRSLPTRFDRGGFARLALNLHRTPNQARRSCSNHAIVFNWARCRDWRLRDGVPFVHCLGLRAN